MYEGLYHVLMGRLSPLDGVGPGELNVEALLRRAANDQVKEVILGTNPTVEGDGTALYLTEALRQRGAKVSRLARGLPTGINIEQASKAVLTDALQGRKSVD
jgi:recombination protein RecR